MPRYNYPGYGPRGDDWLTKRPGTVGGYHGGSDNPAAAGTPVYSEYTGKIFRSGTIAGYGRSVIVRSVAPDGTTFYALYGHLGPGDLPIPGTDVVAGKPILGAVIGSKEYVQSMSGLSTGPHLHREIISGNVRLKETGGLGLYSSQIKHRADPDTFDINHPSFPYERPDRSSARSEPSNDPRQSLPATGQMIISPSGVPPALSLRPGMPIPGAEGSTSVGGPGGPQPVVPPSLPPLVAVRDPRRSDAMEPFDLGIQVAPSLWDSSDNSPASPQAASLRILPASLSGAESMSLLGMLGIFSRPGDLVEREPKQISDEAYPVRRLISRVAQY
ncbi:hypothetical protein ACVIJ6_004435 [Bradyrhizobium sp. USDA 4369]